MLPGTSSQTGASFIPWRQLMESGGLKASKEGVAGPFPHGDKGSTSRLGFLCSVLHPQIQLDLLVSKLFLEVNVVFSSDSYVY